MKSVAKLLVPGLWIFLASPSYSDAIPGDASNIPIINQQTNDSTKDLARFVKNLGLYIGYDLENPPENPNLNVKLLEADNTQLRQRFSFITFLGARPVNAISTALSNFVPQNITPISVINTFVNLTFKTPPFNGPQAAQQGGISVTPLIDQQTYQQDPVSQAVLNILGTPDFSYCLNYEGTQLISDCNFLNQSKVMGNVIGEIPQTKDFFSFNYNQNVLGQLNSNSLLSPLMYSTESTTSGTQQNQQDNNNPGLTANSQAQQAANFILYASGLVTPTDLPKYKEYDTLYVQATTNSDKPTVEQQQAKATLASYLTNLRVYAAQTSVGISNLYYLLSKRIPQDLIPGEANGKTSQALSEFNMATWRLYKPTDQGQQQNQQWIEKINTAAPEAVQKEMAVLLAEINYQMYLSRQQQERILLTETILMLQNAKAAQPSAALGTSGENTNTSDNTGQ